MSKIKILFFLLNCFIIIQCQNYVLLPNDQSIIYYSKLTNTFLLVYNQKDLNDTLWTTNFCHI
jgi:hypothetical protein